MQNINLLNIKVNQIQIFLAAYKFGSFSAAAEYMHVTQPMVSKTIQALEQQLGIILFIRHKGKLQSTPAARECYMNWGNIMGLFSNSIENAHAIQKGTEKHINLGISNLGSKKLNLMNNILDFKEKHGIDVHIYNAPMVQLSDLLLNNTVDVILISKHLMNKINSNHLSYKVIMETNLAIFMHRANALASRRQITFADLRKEEFIAFSPDVDPDYISLLNRLSAEAGFVPKISCYIPNEMSYEPNILLGNGIALIDTDFETYDKSIKKFPLKGLRNDLVFAWNKANASDELLKLIDSLVV